MIGGMTRALLGVGALLAAAFVIFGAVVFLTREEDRVAVDNLLAENLTRAIQLSEEEADGEVDLRRVADFPWDRVLVVAPGTARSTVSEELGSEYKGDLPFGSLGQVFVFARGDELARIADYRGRGTFTGFRRRSTCSRATTPCSGCGIWWYPRRHEPARGTRPHARPLQEGGGRSARGRAEAAARAAPAARRADRRRRAGAPGVRRVRGLGRVRQGRGDPAARRDAGSSPRARSVDRRADPRREAPPLPLALLAALPGAGGMAVLDRSWYGRVLVERVEGFASEEEWRRAYDEIVDFERMLTAEGMLLIKFWLHISDDEQLKRFEARAGDPLKRWKLTADDWRNRERRADYEARARGHVRPHRPAARRRGAWSRRTPSATRA